MLLHRNIGTQRRKGLNFSKKAEAGFRKEMIFELGLESELINNSPVCSRIANYS